MGKNIKIAMIGLDTSHAIEFTRLLQDPDCPSELRVKGMKVTSCLRFSTPFIAEKELDGRQQQMEKWGVKVTKDFKQAIEHCDTIMLEINDPSYHLEYVQKCAELNKPIFLDKPLADTLSNGKGIIEIAKDKSCKIFSASSLRFAPNLIKACHAARIPLSCTVFGALGKAPAGSSIIWYGVHAFEMLQRALGSGAKRIQVKQDRLGITALVEYPDVRRGIVELTKGVWNYGGYVRDREKSIPFIVDGSKLYYNLLIRIRKFFTGTPAPISIYYDTLDIMAMLEAADLSLQTGQPADIQKY